MFRNAGLGFLHRGTRKKRPGVDTSRLSQSQDPMTVFVAALLGPRSQFFQAIARSSKGI